MSDITPSLIDNIFSPKYRQLLGVVIIIAILIAFALGAVVVGMFTQADKSEASAPPPTAFAAPQKPAKPVSMTLAPGFKILSSDTQPGRLILHVRSETQDEIDVIDLNDGHIITQIHAAAPQ